MNILVVDDHALVREGLRQVLKGLGAQTQVHEASTCSHAFDIARALPDLDLVLLDFHLPDMSGYAALDLFGSLHPELPVVIVSGSAIPDIMREVLRRGAAGFIPKSGKSDTLLYALEQILQGGVYTPPTPNVAIALGATNAVETAGAERPVRPDLTTRQSEVLQCLMDGRANRDISVLLNLSEETIKNHVTSILRLLKVQTRMQAVIAAARFGFKPTDS